ncbi:MULTISPECIES: AfsR/SARP family transcriptional regulator [Streptosporangium]|uniref:DNA-binding SARP family transcriptional activator/Flp pilus assembly protein TadD n=1 Tax=Streptosporangium brasiliense TaxID=47480 RepID=A0ABT9RED4_9ACTN|nr:AfsR/SARP family transcriptional regulator [Streptosporangium brasiliense]MDP9867633.1 DNA-binding SARP family transcriptional activator/Flp pilus assembly protein TadD [Streptosporangium brasiliense]
MVVDQPTFSVLGGLDVRTSGRSLRIAGTKPRILLASLLLDANRVVGADLLAEVLWPRHRPRSAHANIRTYVSSLRGVLEAAGARIQARPPGYVIELSTGQLDALLFEDLIAGARAAGRTEESFDRLRRALALWHGTPLADLPASPLWDGRLQALAEVRLAAAEELIALRMARGEYTDAIGELRGLLKEHPFREDLWQRLMLALHWSGRQAEALHAYTTVRRQLVAELGIEPGADLRRAHAAVLAGEPPPAVAGPALPPAVAAVPHPPPPVAAAVSTPHQLPPDVPDFTGRAEAVAVLTRALSPVERPPDGPPLIVVVMGAPGVGKSALAVHCAHAVRAGYPGGQLYLDLGGTEPVPADPGELLAEALRALGVGEAGLPATVRERSALYRSLLAGRPMLVVLDDAAGAAQVRPLLPGSGCAVLVTSRRRITELPGALRLELDVLPPGEAEEFLGRIVGPERLEREREAAVAILRSCGYLPLAVRIAGARLAGRPGWSLEVLGRRLDDESNRLGELRAGDLEVRVSLDRSYRLLPDDAALALRALGLLGPQSLPGWVVDAALDRHRADDVTDVLVDVNLLRLVGTDPIGQPRYRLHDLVRCNAREKAGGLLERNALIRVLGAWMATAESATARLPTTLFSLSAAGATRWNLPADTLGRLTADPLSWLDAEHDTLVGAVRLAADAGLAESAWGLAAALVPYYDLRCHFEEWQSTHRVALEAARLAQDRHGEAAMLRGLAQVCLYQDRYAEATEMFRRALTIFHELGDARGEATSICGLGAVNQFCGEHLRALTYFRQALAMFLAMGDQSGEAYARQAIGRVCLASGNLHQASRWLGEALGLARRLGDPHREGCVSMQLGRFHALVAEPDRAMRFQGRALDIFEGLGDLHCGAYAMQNLGGLQVVRGDRSHASDKLERSLLIFQRLGDRSGEAATVQTLGELHRSAGRTRLAQNYLHHALELRRELRGGADLAGSAGPAALPGDGWRSPDVVRSPLGLVLDGNAVEW